MTTLSVQPSYPIFTDTNGQPLESGYIYIGAANQEPQTNPISVFWDIGQTQPVAQPIRTMGGYPVNNGTPARLYVDSDYSIRVMNRNGTMVYYSPGATERVSSVVFVGQAISTLDLADGAVTTSKIADSAVTNAKLANGSVTPDKLSTGGLYWDSSGNVGIGTTSLGSNDFLLTESKPAGNVTALFENTDTGATSQSLIFARQGAVTTFLSSYGNQFGQTGTSVGSNHPFLLVTNGIERGRFETNGNFHFNSGYGSSAVAYGCRAWVNFNGTGTVAIRASGNVSSITDHAVGQYTINFINAMPDANYSAVMTAQNQSVVNGLVLSPVNDFGIPTASSLAVRCRSAAASDHDSPINYIAVFR